MDSATIESQIKGLLGLNLGGGGNLSLAAAQQLQGGQQQLHAAPGGGPSAPGSYPRDANIRDQEKPDPKNGPQKRKDKTKDKRRDSKVSSSDSPDENALKDPFILKEAEKESKTAQYVPPDSIKQYLDSQRISALKKKSAKFQRAKWFCNVCEYHCDNIIKCYEHCQNVRHSRLVRLKEIDSTVKQLPSPGKLHLEGLTTMLNNTYIEYGLTKDEMAHRQTYAEKVDALLKPALPDCNVRLFGSSMTGFGLKQSDVNLDIEVNDKDLKPHQILVKALDVLQESKAFRKVTDDFASKHPSILVETAEGPELRISLHNNKAHQTSLLLRDYSTCDPRVRVLSTNFRLWAHLTEFDREQDGTLPAHAFSIMLVYFLQQLEKPVLPCIHEMMEDQTSEVYSVDQDKLKEWKSENTETIAELWIKLFKFYSGAGPFKSSQMVVTIRFSEVKSHEDLNWKSKKLTIEDPFSRKTRSLCRSIPHISVFQYIDAALGTAMLYFGSIQTCHGPVVTKILPDKEDEETFSRDGDEKWTLESWIAAKGTELTLKQLEFATSLVPKNMVSFSHNGPHLRDFSVMVKFCNICLTEGHKAKQCPCEELEKLVKLAPLDKQYLDFLTACFERIKNRLMPKVAELRKHDIIMKDLNGFINRYFKDARLTLFGSCANGFGTSNSDLDISLTFKDKPTSEGIDCIQIIEELGNMIKRMAGVKNVQTITSAKVPIVKLWYDQLNVEADISLYNVLARENTDMIRLYSELDPRFKTLGYIVKYFAKQCDIGDASRQTLSSYAYMLMMIFFLQQVQPPVLPVLQEMHAGEEKPENLVEGWNAWYQSDREKIRQQWRTQNNLSVGQLWIMFLSFYAGEWNDKNLVVCIRQKKVLTKFEKMWNSRSIAIEDPFDLSHNLGSGISRRMYLYIKNTFIIARNHFGVPKPKLMDKKFPEDMLFNKSKLTDGPKPIDRGCRACGKIGHMVKDCPSKKGNKGRLRSESDRNDSERGNWRDRTRSEASQVESEEGENEYYNDDTEEVAEVRGHRPEVGAHKRGSSRSAEKEMGRSPATPHNARYQGQGIGQVNSGGGNVVAGLPEMRVPPPQHNQPPPRQHNLPPPPPQHNQPPPQLNKNQHMHREMALNAGPPPTGPPPASGDKFAQLLAQLQQGGAALPKLPPIPGSVQNAGPPGPPGHAGPPGHTRGVPQDSVQDRAGAAASSQKPDHSQFPAALHHLLGSPALAKQQQQMKLNSHPDQPNRSPQPQHAREVRKSGGGGVGGGIDLSALAARAGVSPGKKLPTAAINAEDLEKSMLGTEENRDDRDATPVPQQPPPLPGFGLAPGGLSASKPPPPGFDRRESSLMSGQGSPFMDINQINLLQQLQQQQQQAAAAVSTANPLLFPFLPVGIPLDPRLQQLAANPMAGGMQQQMFGQMPRMFGPMLMGQPSSNLMGQPSTSMMQGQPSNSLMQGQPSTSMMQMSQPRPSVPQDPFPPPLPMCALPGLVPQPAQNEKSPVPEAAEVGGGAAQQLPAAPGHQQQLGPPGGPIHQVEGRRSPDRILPPARAENNSPDGSIQTAPSPLPSANSPIPGGSTPPPLLFGGWNQNPLLPLPMMTPFAGPPPGMSTPPRPFQSFNGAFPMNSFQAQHTGFQSSFLFPCDIPHPLAAGPGTNEDLASAGGQATAADEGLPSSPPIDIREFDLDSMDTFQQQ